MLDLWVVKLLNPFKNDFLYLFREYYLLSNIYFLASDSKNIIYKKIHLQLLSPSYIILDLFRSKSILN